MIKIENSIECMDNVAYMAAIPECYVDLTVTSPPYDNLRKYNGFSWDCDAVINELYRVTKPGGVVVWVVNDATVNGSETGTSFRQAMQFMKYGFRLHDTMIWRKTNPMPKMKTKRYFDVFEYMFVFSKGTPKTFNPILQQCRYAGQTYNSTAKDIRGEGSRTKKEFRLNNTRYKDNIWDIAVSHLKVGHPAVFPEQLATDHILSWSNPGDVVLDPFLGSGTTAVCANMLGRYYLGCDISQEYINMARQRLKEQGTNRVSEEYNYTSDATMVPK